jgi:hypothetical protein
MVVFWVLVITAVVLAVRYLAGPRHGRKPIRFRADARRGRAR